MKNRLLLFVYSASALKLAGHRSEKQQRIPGNGYRCRALGMSNASVADIGDVTSGYWNPAGLHSVEMIFKWRSCTLIILPIWRNTIT